jgi:leader peptidase (prepilin peptidase)/N-methyltransferase
MQLSTVAAAWVAAVVAAAVSPYLARLTLSVPDRGDASWWRPRRPVSRSRLVGVAGVSLGCGALAGASVGRVHWAGVESAGLVGTGLVGSVFVWSGFLWLGLVVTPLVVIDVEHHRLPDRLVYAGLLGGTVFLGGATLLNADASSLLRAAMAAAITFVLFGALTMTTGFGFGDTKLLTVLAGYQGWLGWGYVLSGVIAGFCLGALVCLLLLLSRRVSLKSAVPFGPALVVGALLVSAFGLVPRGLT